MELNELTLDNLIKQPLRTRMTVLIVVFIVILFLIYTLLLKPRLSQLNALKKQQQDLKNTYQTQQSKINKLPIYEKEFVLSQSIDNKILTQLVDKNEFSDLLRTISQLSTQNNVELTVLKPEPEVKQVPYSAMPIRIDLNGDFLNLTRFLNQMARLPKLITFQEMSFTSKPNTHRVFLKAKVIVYRDSGEKINHTTSANFRNLSLPKNKMQNSLFQRDPFSLSKAILNRNENALPKYKLASLRMVGTIEYHHRLWALIAAEDNFVFKVTVGFFLGEHSGQVVAMNQSQIQIRQALDNGEKRMAILSLPEP